MKNYIFSSSIINKLPSAVKEFFVRLRVHAVIVSVLSGVAFGMTLSLVDISFLAGFVPVTIIVAYIFEPMVLAATKASSTVKNMVIRVALGLVLATLNSTGLELVIFNDSIENFFEAESKDEVAEIDSIYRQRAIPLTAQINEHLKFIDSLNSSQGMWSSRLFKEINVGGQGRPEGDGVIAKSFRELRRKDSLTNAPIIVSKQTSIAMLEKKIETLEKERLAKHEQIVAPSERGLLERIKKLRLMLFEQDNIMMRVFYLSLFIAALCIELSTIYVRWNHPDEYELYNEEMNRQIEEKKRKVALEAKYELASEKEQLKLKADQRLLAMRLQDEEERTETIMDHKRKDKKMAIESVLEDSRNKDKLDESELKIFRRKSVKSHLNGVDTHSEKSEE